MIFIGLIGALSIKCHSQNPPVSAKPILYNETFEGDKPFSLAYAMEVGKWEYALQIVTDPAFEGKKSARFEIRVDQPLVKDGKRSEVTIIKGLPSKEMWYSFAVYFPSQGFSKDSQRDAICQWYQDGPATSLRVNNDRMLLETGPEKNKRERIDLGILVKDTWHELIFHFIHSHDRDGLIEIWYDGKKIVTHHGGNLYDDVLPKWKIGLYKAAFKTEKSEVTRRIIFFDNIKVGGAKAVLKDMQPRGIKR